MAYHVTYTRAGQLLGLQISVEQTRIVLNALRDHAVTVRRLLDAPGPMKDWERRAFQKQLEAIDGLRADIIRQWNDPHTALPDGPEAS